MSGRAGDPGGKHPGYFEQSKRPLQVLAFLLPLIMLYEVCLALVLRDGLQTNTVEAHAQLVKFFALFGIAPGGGLFLGGVVLVVILVVWHVLCRDPWHVEWRLTAWMALESLLLTIPVLAIGFLLSGPAAAATSGTTIGDLDLPSQIAITVGAGLYEELAFRMVLIAIVHTLLVDVAGLRDRTGFIIAIVLSAAAFTIYHHSEARPLDGRTAAFFFVAGLYFGGVFAARGFGIVVGVHALYDIVIVLLGQVRELG